MTKQLECPREAGRIIREGGIVAFPTETVFGLGVDATNETAIKKLFAAKARPINNPLIVHIHDHREWPKAASELTPIACTLLDAFSPGPITVVLPKASSISPLVTAGLDSVGLRVPSHPIATEVLKEAHVPVAAPSANLSGRPSATTWKAVVEDLDSRIDAILCKDMSSIGIESTVVECCGDRPVVLRPGAITIEQIQEIIPSAVDFKSSNEQGQTSGNGNVNSPGILHPHYQPKATIYLVEFSSSRPSIEIKENAAYCGVSHFDGVEELDLQVVYESLDAYATGFYEFLREVDRQAISTIYVEKAPNQGIGRALLDRQLRAAGAK